MLIKLILVMTLVPLAELALLVQLTRLWDSLLLTIGIVLATGLIGAALARHEGLRVWHRIEGSLAAGQIPGNSLLDGLLILIAAALLITPGLMTDAVGFLLLIPPTRTAVRKLLTRWLRGKIEAREMFEAESTFVPHWEPSPSEADEDAT
jgi:UPF0716 protein FxsA